MANTGTLTTMECVRPVEVVNTLGIYARPARLFAKTAARFKSNVTVCQQAAAVDGKSVIGILMLEAGQGSELRIHACGSDAEEALEALAELLRCKFDED